MKLSGILTIVSTVGECVRRTKGHDKHATFAEILTPDLARREPVSPPLPAKSQSQTAPPRTGISPSPQSGLGRSGVPGGLLPKWTGTEVDGNGLDWHRLGLGFPGWEGWSRLLLDVPCPFGDPTPCRPRVRLCPAHRSSFMTVCVVFVTIGSTSSSGRTAISGSNMPPSREPPPHRRSLVGPSNNPNRSFSGTDTRCTSDRMPSGACSACSRSPGRAAVGP